MRAQDGKRTGFMRGWRGAAICLIAAGLALTGCTAGGDKPETTTPPPSQASPSGGDGSMKAVADCMVEAGWDVKVNVDASGNESLDAEYPTDQADQYNQALDTCRAASGIGADTPPMTAEEAGRYFDALSETAQCMTDEGFDVPPAPSRQSFIDAATRGKFIWTPYDGFTGGQNGEMDSEGLMRANKACPLPTSF